MIDKIRGIVKGIFYKVVYGKKLLFAALPLIRGDACINIKDGNMKTGYGFNMNHGAYCAILDGGELSIGDDVYINRNTMIICHDRITIGDGCAIGPNVLIYDHDHKFNLEGVQEEFNTDPVEIGNNCWIGGGCTILRGSKIGDGCVIGAASVVSGIIPPHSLVKPNRDLVLTEIKEKR